MTDWETIQDRSAHISPARLTPLKNHSTNRGKDIFDAVLKSSIPTKQFNMTKQHVESIKKKKGNKFTIKSILICVLFIISIPLFWQCYTSEDNACIRVDTTYYTEKAQYTQSFVTSHVTRPFVSNLQNVWMNLTRDEFVYTPIRIMHKYYRTTALPILNSTKASLHLQLIYWKKELDNYINQSSTTETDHIRSEHNLRDSKVEEKLKETARRILEFIELKQKTGMQQDQAKEKAREIIKSIKQETTKELEEEEGEKDMDIISFEIRAIAQVARTERSQLQQQLELLQTRLINEKDTDLVISALKSEIDQLRANAENKVRKRTDQAISHINEITSPTSSIGIEMAQQIQKARRDALKDLRIVYRDIYQINQLMN